MHKVIICRLCETAYLPQDLAKHVYHHNKISLTIEAIQAIIQPLVFRFTLHQDLNVSAPANKMPVEGLKIQDGFLCSHCSHVTSSWGSLQHHWSFKHKALGISLLKDHVQHTSVQSFFSSSSIKANSVSWFPVDITLAIKSSASAFDVFMQVHYPAICAAQAVVATPENERDVPPLLKVMEWHIHLKDFYNNSQARALLLDLFSLPVKLQQATSTLDKTLAQLRPLVDQYLLHVGGLSHNIQRLVLKCLEEYPPYVLFLLVFLFTVLMCISDYLLVPRGSHIKEEKAMTVQFSS